MHLASCKAHQSKWRSWLQEEWQNSKNDHDNTSSRYHVVGTSL